MTLRVLSIAAALTFANAANAQSPKPDLLATEISVPTTINQDTTATVTITVRNDGLSAAGAFDVSVALTRDWGVCTHLNFCDETDDDSWLGSASVEGLAAGAEVTVPVQIRIPSSFSPETWQVFGVVDGPDDHPYWWYGDVDESNEDNNTIFGGSVQIVQTQAGDPDLHATAISVPSTISQGGTATVTLTVRNSGFSAAGAFDVSVALTRDWGVCTQLAFCDESDDDWFLGAVRVNSVAAGAEVIVSVQIVIPAGFSPESWQVFGVVDGPDYHPYWWYGDVDESNENNNTIFGGSLLVSPP
jgi:hypothetical protein